MYVPPPLDQLQGPSEWALQATGGSGMCQADLAAIPGETGVILVASVSLWCVCDEDGLSLPPSFFLRGNGTRLT